MRHCIKIEINGTHNIFENFVKNVQINISSKTVYVNKGI